MVERKKRITGKNARFLSVYVVIINYNSGNGEILRNCVFSVLRSDFTHLQVVVVDNSSTDSSWSLIAKEFSGKIKIIQNKTNLGFSGGNNIGIKYSISKGADMVFLLNPDTEIFPNTISCLVRFLSKSVYSGIAGPRIYAKDGSMWSLGGKVDRKRYTAGLIGFGKRDEKKWEKPQIVDYVPGTAMLIKKEVIEKIGFMLEDYFLYYEDVDYCFLAKKYGFKSCYVPASEIVHDWSLIVGKLSAKKEYYMARNHLLFVERHAPLFVKIREVARLPKTIYYHYKNGNKAAVGGVVDYFLRHFGINENWN